jgi:hypothetical protein
MKSGKDAAIHPKYPLVLLYIKGATIGAAKPRSIKMSII